MTVRALYRVSWLEGENPRRRWEWHVDRFEAKDAANALRNDYQGVEVERLHLPLDRSTAIDLLNRLLDFG